ncbi:MAG TPA: hypothetical protein VE402_04700 [Candidatus Angelobacter sp.]|nr:hypothetical protein [Candidatus Angelobacter sp.]
MKRARGIFGLAIAAMAAAVPVTAGGGAKATPVRAEVVADRRADAAALYNAGTDALSRGDTGRAVAFLLAAQRIDPRARDIRVNLAIARARAEDVQGTGEHQRASPLPGIVLSPAEAWWTAALLALAGALMGGLAALRQTGRGLFVSGTVALTLGVLVWGCLLLRAREERRHPEAVVVVPVLEVGPAPDEQPRSPYLLGAGEEVRLGRTRGDLVEIRVSGNTIGWARRSALWRVADAARYTPRSES